VLEYWNIGIMGSGLRVVEDSGMVGLLKTNMIRIDIIVILAYFLGRKKIKEF
jgi:hypothetical protein